MISNLMMMLQRRSAAPVTRGRRGGSLTLLTGSEVQRHIRDSDSPVQTSNFKLQNFKTSRLGSCYYCSNTYLLLIMSYYYKAHDLGDCAHRRMPHVVLRLVLHALFPPLLRMLCMLYAACRVRCVPIHSTLQPPLPLPLPPPPQPPLLTPVNEILLHPSVHLSTVRGKSASEDGRRGVL